jgi:hypothetical protein
LLAIGKVKIKVSQRKGNERKERRGRNIQQAKKKRKEKRSMKK